MCYSQIIFCRYVLRQCFICSSLKSRLINFIFWKYVLVDFRQIAIIFLKYYNKLRIQYLYFG